MSDAGGGMLRTMAAMDAGYDIDDREFQRNVRVVLEGQAAVTGAAETLVKRTFQELVRPAAFTCRVVREKHNTWK